jgi:hypothetical protein
VSHAAYRVACTPEDEVRGWLVRGGPFAVAADQNPLSALLGSLRLVDEVVGDLLARGEPVTRLARDIPSLTATPKATTPTQNY